MQRNINVILNCLMCLSALSGNLWFTDMAEASDNVWMRIYRGLFGAEEPPVPPTSGGSRPMEKPNVCLISPGQFQPPIAQGQPSEPIALWQPHPLIVWQGSAKHVKVLDESKTVLWKHSIATPSSTIATLPYTGPTLQPGQVYHLELTGTNGLAVQSNVQMIDAEERSRLTKEWVARQERAWAEGLRGEAIVKQRIQFLSTQKLWWDVVHEIFRHDNLASDWQQMRQGIADRTCNPPPDK